MGNTAIQDFHGISLTEKAMAVGHGESTDSGNCYTRGVAEESSLSSLPRHHRCDSEEASNMEAASDSTTRMSDAMGDGLSRHSDRVFYESADGRGSDTAQVPPGDDLANCSKITINGQRGRGSRRRVSSREEMNGAAREKSPHVGLALKNNEDETRRKMGSNQLAPVREASHGACRSGSDRWTSGSGSELLNEVTASGGIPSGGVEEMQVGIQDGHSRHDESVRMKTSKSSTQTKTSKSLTSASQSPSLYPSLNESPSSSVLQLGMSMVGERCIEVQGCGPSRGYHPAAVQQEHYPHHRQHQGMGLSLLQQQQKRYDSECPVQGDNRYAGSWGSSERQLDGVAMARPGSSDLQRGGQRRWGMDSSGTSAATRVCVQEARVLNSDVGGHAGRGSQSLLQGPEEVMSTSNQGQHYENGNPVKRGRDRSGIGGLNAPLAQVVDGACLAGKALDPAQEFSPVRGPFRDSAEEDSVQLSRRANVNEISVAPSSHFSCGLHMVGIDWRRVGNGSDNVGRGGGREEVGAYGEGNDDDGDDDYAYQNSLVPSAERTRSGGKMRRRSLSRRGGLDESAGNPPSSTITSSSARRKLFATLDADDSPSFRLGSRMHLSPSLSHSGVTTDAARAMNCEVEDGSGQQETGFVCDSRSLGGACGDKEEHNFFAPALAVAGKENGHLRRNTRDSHPPSGSYHVAGVHTGLGRGDCPANFGEHAYSGQGEESGEEVDEYFEANDGYDDKAAASIAFHPLAEDNCHNYQASSKLRQATMTTSVAGSGDSGSSDIAVCSAEVGSVVATPASRLAQPLSENGNGHGHRRREAEMEHEEVVFQSALIRSQNPQMASSHAAINGGTENSRSSLDGKIAGLLAGGHLSRWYAPNGTPPSLLPCREDSIFKGLDLDKDIESSDCASPCDGQMKLSGAATWGQSERDVSPQSGGFDDMMTTYEGRPTHPSQISKFEDVGEPKTVDNSGKRSRLSISGFPVTRYGDVNVPPVKAHSWDSCNNGGEGSTLDGEEADIAGDRINRTDQDGTEVAFRTPGDVRLPPNVHVSSYLLGERTALERALHTCLPQRDQISMLHASVSNLKSVSHQDACRIRQLENAGTGLRSSVSGISDRLQSIEGRLYPLESSLAEVRSGVSAYMGVIARLGQLQDRLASLEACQHQQLQALLLRKHQEEQGSTHSVLYRVGQLLLSHLSKVDIVSLLLAQKILLDARGIDGGKQDTLPVNMARGNCEGSESGVASSSASTTKPERESFSLTIRFLSRLLSLARVPMKKQRSVMGAMLLVAAIETGWRLQVVLRAPLPKFLQRMTAPVEYGMRVARMCVWMSAFVVGTSEVKSICFNIADTVARAQQVRRTGKERLCQQKGEEPWLSCKVDEQRSWWPLGWANASRATTASSSHPPKFIDMSIMEPNVSLPQTPRPYTLPPPGDPQLEFDIEAGHVVKKELGREEE